MGEGPDAEGSVNTEGCTDVKQRKGTSWGKGEGTMENKEQK